MTEKVVLVIGTGTIGEPLITLLSKFRGPLGIDDVYFLKSQALLNDKSKVKELLKSGAKLCVTSRKKFVDFTNLGIEPSCTVNEALQKASVVIDCTPTGQGVNNKETLYEIYSEVYAQNICGFIAQGTESRFGKPYAYSINDDVITSDDRFIQVVGCNTHNIACLLKTLAFEDNKSMLNYGNFVCIRRSGDVSEPGMVASPTLMRHDDDKFGTYHARNVHRLFKTMGEDIRVFSSAIQIPSQYMHIIQFHIELTEETSLQGVIHKLQSNPLIAITEKLDTGTVVAFARDHSPIYGRLLNQAIIPLSTLFVEGNKIVGYSYTSQDGNSLLSSTAAIERFLYPDSYREKTKCLLELVFREV